MAARAATLDEWQSAFLASSDATFFHGPAWSLAWTDSTKGLFRPSPRRVVLPEGQTAILGVTVERARFGRPTHHLSPAGTYGGWVSGDPLEPGDLDLLESEIRRLYPVSWRRAPHAGHSAAGAMDLAAERTHVIDLRDGAEAARGRWTDSARRRVRHASRQGVVVREASTERDWDAYDALYRVSLERWGVEASSTYGRELFAALRARGGDAVRLWLAELDERLVAGALVVSAHRHAAYWHGASDPSIAKGASNLLHWEIIGALAGSGALIYDLNPSGGHPGTVRFKETLGAAAAPAPMLVRRDPARTLARAIMSRRLGPPRRGGDARAA